jgi:uncharacterized delta-60 repeat protein
MNARYDFALARYNMNGTLDTSFGLGGKVITSVVSGNDYAYAARLQRDGRIVAAGAGFNGTNDEFALVRYNINGTLDDSFGTGGIVTTPITGDAAVRALALQPNDKIVAAGFTPGQGGTDFVTARYNTNGTVDTSFGTNGKVITPIGGSTEVAQAVTIQSDGKILAAGNTSGLNYDSVLLRFLNDAPIDTAVPGSAIISELRLSGTAGALDEFIELYNNTDAGIAVSSADGSNGWSLVASDGAVRYTVPFNTIIPARGHYLVANNSVNGYSLNNHPAGNLTTAIADGTYTADIADNTGLVLYRTSNPANFTPANLLDAVGFGSTTAPYMEGAALPSIGTPNVEYSVARKLSAAPGQPQDTNNNAADFRIVSTDGTVGGTAATLGSPAPENRSSSIIRSNAQLTASLVDPLCGGYGSYNAPNNASAGCQNRVLDATPEPSVGATGSLYIRRSFTNNTGVPITRLRFRIVDITTFPAPAGTADLRALTSTDATANVNNGTGTTALTIKGTTLETPPAQTNGGGFNSALAAGYVTLDAPLAPGATTNVQFKLARVQGGQFRFFIFAESLP